jgi:hypothetical protein
MLDEIEIFIECLVEAAEGQAARLLGHDLADEGDAFRRR